MSKTHTTFAFRPRPFAAETLLALRQRDMFAQRAGKDMIIPYREIETIRLFYAPRGINFSGFRAKIYIRTGKTVSFEDRSHKSLIETERLDDSYRAFIIELCARAEGANANVLLYAGKSVTLLALAAFLGIAAVVLLALFAWNALHANQTLISIGVAAFAIFFAAWTANFVIRNRPRRFTANTIPAEMLPPPEAG